MARDTKILQALLDGQVSIRQDLKKVNKKIDDVEERLTSRIDKLGSQLSYLEDDAPTREGLDNLEKRVGKVETKTSSL